MYRIRNLFIILVIIMATVSFVAPAETVQAQDGGLGPISCAEYSAMLSGIYPASPGAFGTFGTFTGGPYTFHFSYVGDPGDSDVSIIYAPDPSAILVDPISIPGTLTYNMPGDPGAQAGGLGFFIYNGDGSASIEVTLSCPTSQPAPQIGMIQISASQAQPVYDSAGGDIVRIEGEELWIPQDYDGNGFDTHVVISQVEIDGRLWLEIFIGNGSSLVWVPADMVTILE